MISERMAKSFCREDASKIENYNLAISDDTQKWEIHHRLEIIENKSKEQLTKEGRYYKRPACELILLTKAEHTRLHKMGENHPMFGKHLSEEHKQKLVDASHKKAVLQFTKTGEFVAEYPSTHEAGRQTNIPQSNIIFCCQGKRHSAGGYVWKYKED